MMMLPGVDKPLELRHAPHAAKSIAGYDPVTFQVDQKEDLDNWAKHFDKAGWKHSEVIQGYIGHLIELKTPDGLELRFYTKPLGGFENVEFKPQGADIHNSSVDTDFTKS